MCLERQKRHGGAHVRWSTLVLLHLWTGTPTPLPIILDIAETHFSLEFDLHTLILKDLAANVGQADNPAVLDAGISLLGSRVELRAPPESKELMNGAIEPERAFMVSPWYDTFSPCILTETIQSSSRVHCHIAFGELAQNLPSSHLESAIPVLLDMLRDIPYIDFDTSLNWSGAYRSLFRSFPFSIHSVDWALPDQLVYSTVTALLRLAEKNADNKGRIVGAIIKLSSEIVAQIQSQPRMYLVSNSFLP